jgi:hypothetical protein
MDRVSFTPRSAQRIARVVRAVENARPPGVALEFRAQIIEADKKVFRVATYTGAWSIGSAKTVTFKNQTNTPNTVSATNLFFPVASTAAGSRDCAVARDGTAWYLIDVRLSTATAIFVTRTSEKTFVTSTVSGISVSGVTSRQYVSGIASQQVVSDIAISATLNSSNCTITISKQLTMTSVSVCAGVSAGLFVTGTQTAAFASGVTTGVFAEETATASYLTLQ